jgi:hypothetical protein
MSDHLEAYLDELQRALRCRGALRARILEEVRGHMLDAVEAGERQDAAIERFGPARALARDFAAERRRSVQRVLCAVAVGLGLLLGYVDSRPTWDDTGISAGLLLISSGILGALGPERPWLWALCVGIWILVFGISTGMNFGSLIALAVAFAGAYSGMLVRRAVIPT